MSTTRLIVDTHVHAGKNWFEPIESLLFQMKQNGVDKVRKATRSHSNTTQAVLIQHKGLMNTKCRTNPSYY
jgi:hypothetical protein